MFRGPLLSFCETPNLHNFIIFYSLEKNKKARSNVLPAGVESAGTQSAGTQTERGFVGSNVEVEFALAVGKGGGGEGFGLGGEGGGALVLEGFAAGQAQQRVFDYLHTETKNTLFKYIKRYFLKIIKDTFFF